MGNSKWECGSKGSGSSFYSFHVLPLSLSFDYHAAARRFNPMFQVAAAVALPFTFSQDPMEAEQLRLFNLELTRFPPAKVAKTNLKLNSKHLHWLKSLIENSPTKQLIRWYDECSNCQEYWFFLHLAQDSTEELSTRLWALEGLRNKLGEVAFAQGHMPPPVPIWRFKEGPPPLGTCLPYHDSKKPS
jgi:hypothetical protein